MKKWKILNKKEISSENIMKILLENRGINAKEADAFLNPKLSDLTLKNAGLDHKNVKKAIERIREAIEKKEKIIIYGDYDADGISSTAIVWETIYAFYKNVLPFIPDRVEEGYGLSIKGISVIKAQDPDVKLIITVDNGIVAGEAVDFANKNGIDVIITDHHVLPKKIPEALAIVHTTRLCGAGIAYLFAGEIKNKFSIETIKEDNHLELAALATITDLMPLTGLNRVIVKFGLEKLKKTKRIGLQKLFIRAGIDKEKIGVYEAGFIIGPRFNATGRIRSATAALRLICTSQEDKADGLAQDLDRINRERQGLTIETFLEVKASLPVAQAKIIFAYHENYNQGIIGLVAARLVEEFYRPSFVLSVGEKYSKGSARSIPGFNIIEFIKSFPGFLVDAGGHPMAAGFTIETEKIEIFKQKLEEKAEEALPKGLFERNLNIDTKLDFSLISPELYREMQVLAPFGAGNPEPAFASCQVTVRDLRKVGKTGDHLKLGLEQNGTKLEAIAFGFGKDTNLKIGDKIDLAYCLDQNVWNGEERLQLKVKDVIAS